LAKVAGRGGRLQKDGYEKGLRRLQTHLVRLQEWVRNEGLKVVVLFEGRDAAGKGGVIKRITESLSVLVLPASLPLAHPLNARRHNGISSAMSPTCPLPEKLVSSTAVGTIVPAWNVLWDSAHPRRWKSSTAPARNSSECSCAEARVRWVEYSHAKDDMFRHTDIRQAPWYVVDADDKRRARLNCIHPLLRLLPYEDLPPPKLTLPARQPDTGYVRPPLDEQSFVPQVY